MRKVLIIVSLLLVKFIVAQDNYEIQVYGSPTMDKGNTMFELHSNFTFSGEKNIVEGVNSYVSCSS